MTSIIITSASGDCAVMYVYHENVLYGPKFQFSTFELDIAKQRGAAL
jgi:hypothetical protein